MVKIKVYLFYLSLPEDLYSEFPKRMVDGFSLIEEKVLNIIECKEQINNRRYYLYAFTNNKEFANIFEYMHDKNIFKKVKKDMTKYDYEELKSASKSSELIAYNFKTGLVISDISKIDKYLVCTRSEEICLAEEFDEVIMNDIMMYTFNNYEMFKDEYIRVLDLLMYCTYHKINYNDCDFYSYNLSYGCSAEGYLSGGNIVSPNIIAIYIKIFALLLRKD